MNTEKHALDGAETPPIKSLRINRDVTSDGPLKMCTPCGMLVLVNNDSLEHHTYRVTVLKELYTFEHQIRRQEIWTCPTCAHRSVASDVKIK